MVETLTKETDKRKTVLSTPEYPRSPNPKYITGAGKEFVIEPKGYFFFIKPWGGGLMPTVLNSLFTNFKDAEQTLIAYLRDNDRIGKAVYPGKK